MSKNVPSRPGHPNAFCLPLSGGRQLEIPMFVPVGIIVIILVILGYDVYAAVAAVLAVGSAARHMI